MFPALISIAGALGGLVKLALPNIKPITEILVGNQAARDQYNAEADKAAQETYAKEFSYPLGASRTTVDVFVDAVNRLSRPMVSFSLWLMLLLTCVMPDRMANAYRSMAIIPDMLWNILLVVVGFWFAGRMIEKVDWRKGYKPSAASADYGDTKHGFVSQQVPAGEFTRLLDGDPDPEQRDELLRLAGYGPGVLTSSGFTGRLPRSRANGWRNPIALRYAAAS